MKKTIITISIVLCSLSTALAEDIPFEPYTAPDIPAVEETTSPAATSAVMPSILSPVTEAPKLSRQDRAMLHLSLIRDEVETMQAAGFLGGLFSSGSELQDNLLQEIDIFLTIYHDLAIASEALLLKGQLQLKQNHEAAAAVSWLQNLYEYPTSETSSKTLQHFNDLVDNDLKQFVVEFRHISKNIPEANRAARLNKLITQLYAINDAEVTQALITLQIDFLKRFPDDSHADEVQVLLAHNLGTKSAESGVFSFQKLLALYPDSLYRPEAILATGDLQRLRLKEYEKAANNYKLLIQEHPKHTLAKNAYENLGLTQEKHLKTYPEAVATYQHISTNYPDDKAALNALQRIASLQETKTDQPREAVATLRKLATMFKGSEAVDALEDAIKIADKKLKDPALTLESREQLIRDFPDSKAAPENLFKMAESIEKTGDKQRAGELYRKFIQQYPDHKLVKKAKKRV